MTKCLPQSTNTLKQLIPKGMNSSSTQATAVEITDGQTMYSEVKGR